jgi:hypothetical protein
MLEIDVCPECGVPEPFKDGQEWLNNGDIVQRLNRHARVGFFECENLDPLIKNIGDIIGVSIEHMIMNIQARAIELYMKRLIPRDISDMVIAREMDPTILAEPIISLCQVVGFGQYEFINYRYERDENDFYRQRITGPYSVPLAGGSLAGALSAIVGGEHRITYEEVGPDCYEFTTSWTEYPKELMRRFTLATYRHVEGDLKLERCSSCEMPKAFSNYHWDLDKGIIRSGYSGRRMAMLGPGSLDQLFEELEKELGDQIPHVVVEAQRRFVRTGFYPIDRLSDQSDFRTQLALRGLGNLRQIEMGPAGLNMRIDNAAGYLMSIGMVQGLFEMTFDIDSDVEWEMSEDGNLLVEITPRQVSSSTP